MERTEVIEVIYHAIRNINELREPGEQLSCAEDTGLYGSKGGLDSLGLVGLVVDVEEAVNNRLGAQFGTRLVLADEHAMSQQRNPFRDVRSLADYVLARLKEASGCKTAGSC